MKTPFWKLMTTLFFIILTLLFAITGYPQDIDIAKYPSRPITFVDPFSAGGSSDLAIRLLGKEIEKYLGQPIVVVNKPGGGGTIGVSAIASAKPDGYTIGQSVGGAPLFILPFLEKVPYHPIKDLRQIIQYSAPNFGVIVKADSPFKSFKDLIAYAHQNPKKVIYGTNAPNSISNLIMEQIAKKEGVQFTHIPFKASPEYQTALLGGHVLFTAGDFAFPLVEAGQTRILLFLLDKRSDDYPQLPILKDLGYDILVPVMFTITSPKGIPDEIAKKLEDAFTKAIKEPAFLKGMRDLRLTIIYRNSREIADYMAHNYEFFGKFLKEMGLMK
jgi:tripartite-type tricarboxylate transporter receptor subunit TctC